MSDAQSSAPSAPLTGNAAEQAKHGYTPMAEQDGPAEPPKKRKEFRTARDAGEALLSHRNRMGRTQNPTEEIAYRNPTDGSIVDEKQTVSLNRAADDLKGHRDAHAGIVDAIDTMDIADKIDAHRIANADAIAEFNGTPTEPNQPQIEQADPESAQFERDAIAAGIDPALAQTLKHPQARQALENELAKVGQLQAQHAQQIEIAQHFARDNWLAGYPELSRLPVDQIAPALARMAQTNPQRFNAAMASLRRVGETAGISEHYAAQRAHAERQQFQRDAQIHDANFDRMVGHRTAAQKQADAMEMLSYAAELNIDQRTLIHLLQTNPILRHASFQKMMYDAIQARVSKRNAANYRDHLVRDLPPVQRPGTSHRGSGHAASGEVSALAKKANASGSLKDMAALLAAKRRGR